ncbi:UV DNA damage repair endonuclease UvsE [Proteinivorax tanatarense]|uniref:UV DNA damage repair endonuclease UvsE n=1 Tax=Proteinivorax tanatarense TaxID=1260629 RepID=A0AAU7VP55_9FIRM
MKLGYACIPFSIEERTNKSFRLSNLSKERFYQTTQQNIEGLKNILTWNIQHDIFLFRISSDIIPFGSHPDNKFNWANDFKPDLREIAGIIEKNKIRVSFHPGQYTVLNSPKEKVRQQAMNDLVYHCRFLDEMELDYTHKVVLHCGGVYNDKLKSMARLKDILSEVPKNVLSRLVLENDDKSYDIADTLEVANHANIPVIFDLFHHRCNSPTKKNEYYWFKKSVNTWSKKDGVPKVHYSNQAEGKKIGSHSLTISSEDFIEFYNKYKNYNVDVMLEVKDKELSVLKCQNLVNDGLSVKHRTDIWALYKYAVMEKDYSLYKECSKVINSDINITEFYKIVDKAILMPINYGSFANAAEHIWGYFKNQATQSEKKRFFDTLKQRDVKKVKKILWALTKKYNNEYLKKSYFFCY